MRRPLVLLFVALITGVLIGDTLSPHPLGVLVFAACLIAAGLGYLRKGDDALSVHLWILFSLLIVCIGVLRHNWAVERNLRKTDEAFRVARYGEVILEAVVDRPVEVRERKFRFVVTRAATLYEGRRYPVPVRCLVEGKKKATPDLAYGDKVVLKGRLFPVNSASIPGGFDYRQYLASQNIHARFWMTGDSVETVGRDRLGPLRQFVLAATVVRQFTRDTIHRHLPTDQAALLAAILLGDRAQLPEGLTQRLVTSGLMHLTAVSGLHVTFLTAALFWFLKASGLRRRTAAAVAIPCIFFFMAVVGFRLPVVRAVLMGAAVMLPWMIERDLDTLSSVSLAGIVIVLWSPLSVFQMGFQMSFTAVVTLVVFMPWWDKMIRFRSQSLRWGWDILGASIFAQAAISPILAWHHSVVSIAGLIGNLVAIPIVFLLLIGAPAMVILSPAVPSLASLIAMPCSFLLLALQRWIELTGGISLGHFYVSRPHPVFVVGWYLALCFLATGRIYIELGSPRRVIRKPFVAGAAAVVLLWVWVLWPAPELLRIDFLSLGQGDCIYCEFPGGGNLLVDGGPQYSEQERNIELVQFLRRRGVQEIDAVVNTHPQEDHIGCLPEVFDALDVEAFFHSGAPCSSEICESLEERVALEGCPCIALERGQQIHGYDGVTIEVLSPCPRYLSMTDLDANIYSVVLRIGYGEFSCLLTGDITEEVEDELIRAGLLGRSWVLKVPHHGSKSSSSEKFIRSVQPEVAIVQVGRNTYGHPSPEVIERYEEQGVLIFETDEDGTITITSDGREYSVLPLRRDMIYEREG